MRQTADPAGYGRAYRSPRKGLLDIYYENYVTLPKKVPIRVIETPNGDVLEFENDQMIHGPTGEILDDRGTRAERYALQSAARRLMPKERVGRCLRFPVPNFEIEVWRNRKSAKSFYAGLAVCGSVWMCPVCAAKVSERRRKELSSAITQHTGNGGQVAMLTLTVRHTYEDDLYELKLRLAKAMTRFQSGKRASSLRQRIGLIGSVRAFELTHGGNGWHPHFHILLFYENWQKLDDLKQEYIALWKVACAANGLESMEQGISLQNAQDAAYYASKWGAESEMTKSYAKRGGGEKGRTPFDILRDYLADPSDRDRLLFTTYAKIFKGTRQLYWSPGLKARFDLQDLTDEQIATKKEEPADILGIVPWEVWRQAAIKKDLRETLLGLTEDVPFELALEEIVRLSEQN